MDGHILTMNCQLSISYFLFADYFLFSEYCGLFGFMFLQKFRNKKLFADHILRSMLVFFLSRDMIYAGTCFW